ncbi:MAG: BrnT family toxin [Paraburkholderia sp.]|uniref:BrnT family toxin n=1 Tax=Paraburkholderia sp. TaxID=1926495 RepID=UPI0011FE550B|nr:BrnT family toxin [Paraburkholderia sp.]TAL92480.1 MAG: BrnT family toxin [Paraburkholderia sp.]
MITVDRISHSANYLDKKQYGIARMSVGGARGTMANLEAVVRIAFVAMVWTPRGEVRRIISMRKANEREKARYAARLD